MTPRRQLPIAPVSPAMTPPSPLAMAPMPMMEGMVPMGSNDASGAQAIGGLANMAGLLAQRVGNKPKNSKVTDAPIRRKTPMAQMEPTYA